MTQESRTEAGGATGAEAEDAEVQQYFDRFAAALTAGDGRAIAKMWETPALVLDDAAVRAVASLQEVEAFFAGAKAQYNARGIMEARADIRRIHWATDKLALVTVRWPYLDAKGQEIGEEISTYTLRRDDRGALKMRVVVMHGASRPH